MPHEGGPDGNIVNAIEAMHRDLVEKIDGQTDALRQLLEINAEMLEIERSRLAMEKAEQCRQVCSD